MSDYSDRAATEREPLVGDRSHSPTQYVPGDDSIENGYPMPRLRRRGSTISSIASGYNAIREHMDKRKFVSLVITSIVIYLGFVALFAPRTSLSRDFRRWHSSKLTTAEVFRIYLNALQDENRIKKHVHSLTEGNTNSLDYMLQQFHELGYRPKLENIYPWITQHVDTQLKLISGGETIWDAPLIEDCNESSACIAHNNHTATTKGFHYYAPNGNVTAQYVYCNYGTLEDYETLLQNGIDIDGKIHIVRYGDINRGLKVKNAQLYGASAVIMYTDPYDDGLITESNGYTPFPKGPARNPTAIERGTVEFFTESPGDPTTPGYSSKFPDTERHSPAGKFSMIPSIPVSARDIQPILEKLNGCGKQLGSRGNIYGFRYFSGPSPEDIQVQLYNEQNTSIVKMTNLVVDIPGIFADGETIIGCHRDTWSLSNTGESASGCAILLEIASGMKTLLHKGWKPLRPIRFVSWDGEENGMLGSTEYIDEHSDVLQRSALAYLNLDKAVTGSQFTVAAHPLLENVIKTAARYTNFKGQDDVTLHDEWTRTSNATVDHLNGDSDYLGFQYHLGIPSASFNFAQNNSGDAIYHWHSLFDSVQFVEDFIDGDYKLHNTLATFTGIVALMMSENELNNFKTHSLFEILYEKYSYLYEGILNAFPHDNELQKLADSLSTTVEILAKMDSVRFDSKNKKLARDCVQDYPVWALLTKLKLYLNLLRSNNKLKQIDRLFVTKIGLNDREWLKHSVFSPNKYTGIQGCTIPGIYEALIETDRDQVHQWLILLSTQLNNMRYLLL
ncbi:putative zinc metalloprotease KNAG_0B06840 [Huiozyma naganishii CBS 8797]|uniref:Uncharacterized protein n=1 Tax=Huiozyma naganishii (strain ATCC MYA-139 / BCRC 22969 / CBS 8797 / KCTC 17520 / NBRC 10181 / NCYC 3082 / Yp74L-3) TaxID=1071383 RepID=J7RHT8_HUIN7|nr:hypothetical protein KNAG_0B06840 [Kazachstania naganishii CBS 8797]CCK69108.1 hypothetical protein KNAG_0B06840 [Kazachstania naganishii CBS 8797]